MQDTAPDELEQLTGGARPATPQELGAPPDQIRPRPRKRNPQPEVIAAVPITEGNSARRDTGITSSKMTHGPVRPKADPTTTQPLPRPPRFDCSEKPQQFFDYWASLRPDEATRTLVYVYRNWPVWDPGLLLTEDERGKVIRKELRLVSNIAKLDLPFDPKHWEHEVFHRFGSGDYHFKLNDVSFKKTVCMANVRGLRDFDNYPPVLDPRTVVMSDPANASYIERMRIKGVRFPGDTGYKATTDEEDDVASNDAVREMAQAVTSMADKVMERDRNRVDPTAHAESKAVETVAAAAAKSLDMMGDVMKRVQDTQGQAADPKAYFTDVLKMATALLGGEGGIAARQAPAPAPPPPPPAPTGPTVGEDGLTPMGRLMVNMLEKQMASQEAMFRLQMDEIKLRLATAEKSADTARAAALSAVQTSVQHAQNPQGGPTVNQGGPERPGDLLSQLDRLITLKDRLEGLGGGGGKGSDVPAWVPYAVQAVSILGNAGSNIFYNIAAAKNGGTAMPPPELDGEVEGIEDGTETQQSQGGPGMDVQKFLAKVEPHLTDALRIDMNGAEFGGRMILAEGLMTYGYLAGQSKDQLCALLQQRPALWGNLISHGPRLDKFLDDFRNTAGAMEISIRIQAAAQGQGQGQGQGQPPPQAAPKPRSVPREGGGKVEVLPPTGQPPAHASGPANRRTGGGGSGGGGPVINVKSQPGSDTPEPPAA